jgi:hypothetical protein
MVSSLQSHLNGALSSVEEPVGCVSRPPSWSLCIGLRQVIVVLGGAIAVRGKMMDRDMGRWPDGGGFGARPR